MHEYLIASLFPYNVCVTILGEKKRFSLFVSNKMFWIFKSPTAEESGPKQWGDAQE